MSDYERIKEQIKTDGYSPQYDIDNLIQNVFDYYDIEREESGKEFILDECLEYVELCGGWKEFDHEV